MKALLDTHILIWWLSDLKKLNRAQKRVLSAAKAHAPLYVSDITLLEIATLVRNGRYRIDRPVEEWLAGATALPLVERVPISPKIAAEVAHLPSNFHGDPADQVIVATARVIGATLLTADSKIIDAGVVRTM